MRLIRLLKNDPAREAAEWVNQEVISLSQAEAICHRYGVDFRQATSRSLGYNALVALGFLFIGLAIIRPDHPSQTLTSNQNGFSLNAAVACQPHQRDSLERLCHYVNRPAFS